MRSGSQIYSRYFTYIKPLTKIPIVRTYGSTIFTLIVMVVFIIFAIKPTVETILVLQKKLVDSNIILEKLNEKANNLGLAKQNYEKMDQDIKTAITEAIPDSAKLNSISQTLENLAIKNEASVSALQIQPQTFETKNEDNLGTVSEIGFTFNATGGYKNLIALLQDLKSSSRLISVDKLSLSTLSQGGGLLMSLSGKAFYIK